MVVTSQHQKKTKGPSPERITTMRNILTTKPPIVESTRRPV